MKDYIEREKVFKDLLDQCKITGYGGLTANDVKYVFSLQANADVKPVVRGEWELDSDGLPICSNCGEIALQRVFVKVPRLIQDVRMVRSNYCPNCGADMRGEN